MQNKQDPFEGNISLGEIQKFKEAAPAKPKAAPAQKTVQSLARPTNTTLAGGPADKIIIDPEAPRINEEVEKTAVMAFGRYNPPTVGHEKLIHKVEDVAQEHGGTAHIIASHSEGTSKNPLPQNDKLEYLAKVTKPGTKVMGSSKSEPTIMHAAAKLHAQGHKHLVVVAGEDRVDEFQKTLHKYNGVEGKHGLYNFKSIKVVSAGHRDPDAEGTEGMSGTKMRELAHAGKDKEFKAGLPKALHPHAKKIADSIRAINEDLVVEAASVQQRMHRAMEMRRYRAKIEKARTIALKRMAGSKNLQRRSLKRAKDILRTKIAGSRGSQYHKLTPQERVAIDKMVDSKKAAIKKIAGKIYNRVRQDEFRRYTAQATGKKSTNQKIAIMASLEMSFKDRVALREKAEGNGVPFDVISEVFARGAADWQNIETPTNTKNQHAFARVNSYISHGKAYDLDQDLRKENE